MKATATELKSILKEALKIQGDLFPDEQAATIKDTIAFFNKCSKEDKQILFDIEKEGLVLTKKIGHLNPNYGDSPEIELFMEKYNKVYTILLEKYENESK